MKKKVLILGASSDIGKALVKKFNLENFELYLHYNKSKKFLHITKGIKLVQLDFLNIKNEKFFLNYIKKIKNVKFDIIINLVGFFKKKTSFQNLKTEDIKKYIHINSIIPLLILNHYIKFMIRKKYGRILFCSSIGVKYGGGLNNFAYSLSKHTSEFIPKYIRDLSNKNILMNVVRIGACNTKFLKKTKSKSELKKRKKLIPVNKLCTPSEIAEYLYFLVSEKNSYTASQIFDIAGGE